MAVAVAEAELVLLLEMMLDDELWLVLDEGTDDVVEVMKLLELDMVEDCVEEGRLEDVDTTELVELNVLDVCEELDD